MVVSKFAFVFGNISTILYISKQIERNLSCARLPIHRRIYYELREKKKTAYEMYIELRKTNTITRLGIRKFFQDKSSIFTCFLRIKLGNKYAAVCGL